MRLRPVLWFMACLATVGTGYDQPVSILADDFEAATLTGWVQHPADRWTASDEAPVSGSFSLRPLKTDSAGTATIARALAGLDLKAGTTTWRFTLANGAWDPSGNNRFAIFLLADRDVLTGPVNAYAVGVNLTGTSDLLTLWRVANGVPEALLTSTLDWDARTTATVEVTRSETGRWGLRYQVGGGFEAPLSAGTHVDTARVDAAFFGLSFAYTASRSEALWLDDVAITQEAGADWPPSVSAVQRGVHIPEASHPTPITAVVTDDRAVRRVDVQFQINDEPLQHGVMEQAGGETYAAAIPAEAYEDGDRVAYRVVAEDEAGQRAESGWASFFAGTTPIARLRTVDEEGVLLHEGIAVRVRGVATVSNRTFTASTLDVYLQDETGGLNLQKSGGGSVSVEAGHRYTVTGVLNQSRGEAQVEPDDFGESIVDEGPAPMPEPLVHRIADLLTDPEAYEGRLVRIEQAAPVGEYAWPGEGTDATLDLSDDGGATTLELVIDSDTNIDGAPEPGWPAAPTGVFIQADGSRPYTERYQLLPRSLSDLTGRPPDEPPKIDSVRHTPRLPNADQSLTVYAEATDDAGPVAVEVCYAINEGEASCTAMAAQEGDYDYAGELPATAYEDGDRITYRVTATDTAGQQATSAETTLFAGTTPIRRLRPVDGEGRLQYEGHYVRVQGVATVSSGTFSSTTLDVYLEDNTGGLNLYLPDGKDLVVQEGHRYRAEGHLNQTGGEAELRPEQDAGGLVDLGAGDSLKPIEATLVELLARPEDYEGRLVRVPDLESTGLGDPWPLTRATAELEVRDGTGLLVLRIDADTDIDGNPEPAWPKTVTGLFRQSASKPYTDGYQILPRRLSDFDGERPNEPPVIESVTRGARVPAVDEPAPVEAVVRDDQGLVRVELFVTVGQGEEQVVPMSEAGGGHYRGVLPAGRYGNGSLVAYRVVVEDTGGRVVESRTERFFAGITPVAALRSVDDEGRLVYDGVYARVQGVATVSNGTFSSSVLDVYLQDETGGLNLYHADGEDTPFVQGRRYLVTGRLDQTSGEADLRPDDPEADLIDQGSAEDPVPRTITLAELLGDPESFEGRLVQVSGVEATGAGDPWPATRGTAELEVSDGTGRMVVRIDADTDIDGKPEPSWPVTATAIVRQDDTLPYDEGYQLLPRSIDDLGGFIPNDPPVVEGVRRSERVPRAGQATTVAAEVTDPQGTVTVTLWYQVDDGEERPVSMTARGEHTYEGLLPENANGDGNRLSYRVVAEDVGGLTDESETFQVFTGTTSISKLRAVDEEGRLVFDDVDVRVSGVATVSNGTFSASVLDVYLQDETGGLNVYHTDGEDVPFVSGTRYSVTGVLNQTGGEAQIRPEDPVADIVDQGAAEDPLARRVTLAELLGDPEAHEGRLVQVHDITPVGGAPWPVARGLAELEVSDGSETLMLRIDPDTDLDATPEPLWPAAVTAIVTQADSKRPYDAGYQLLPRSLADIEEVPRAPPRLVSMDHQPRFFTGGDTLRVQAHIEAKAGVRVAEVQYTVNGDDTLSVPMIETTPGTYAAEFLPKGITEGDGLEVNVWVEDGQDNILQERVTQSLVGTVPVAGIRATDGVGRAWYEGYRARVQGVATVGTDTTGPPEALVFVQDSTGGVAVPVATGRVQVIEGHRYLVSGVVRSVYGQVYLVPDTVSVGLRDVGAGGGIEPVAVTLAGVLAAPEAYEGRLITIDRVKMSKAGSPWPDPGTGATLVVSDDGGTTTMPLVVEAETGIGDHAEPAWPQTLRALVGQEDRRPPYDDGYYLRIRRFSDFSPAEAPTSTGMPSDDLPAQVSLSPAYPNPFNPHTRFTLALDRPQPVRVEVYNAAGRRVAVLHDGPLPAGRHAFVFQADTQPSGLYLVRVIGEQFRRSNKVLLVK